MGNVTPEHIQGILLNPFYVITCDPHLIEEHVPGTSEQAWVQANALLIEAMGTEQWLTRLLDVLEGKFAGESPMNPGNAISIAPLFAVEHQLAFPKEVWVKANVRSIAEIGVESWLIRFLDVLRGNFVTAEDLRLGSNSTLTVGVGRWRTRKKGKKKRNQR
jgi:hypothetical protein